MRRRLGPGLIAVALMCAVSAEAAPEGDIMRHLESGLTGVLKDHHDGDGGTIEIELAPGKVLIATYRGATFDVVAGWKAAADKAGTPRAMTVGWSAEKARVHAKDVATGTALVLSDMTALHPLDLAAEVCETKARAGSRTELFAALTACKGQHLAGWEAELKRVFAAAGGPKSKGLGSAHAGWVQFSAGWKSYLSTEYDGFEKTSHHADYLDGRIDLIRSYARLLAESRNW